jgi:glycosyltransferase involved in cell wall biosynthesis
MTPRVSIVTTVYDRVTCLARCLRSVQLLELTDLEHIVVSDSPPSTVVHQLEVLTTAAGSRVRYINLAQRANDWGITPASTGLQHAVGDYVCFLSDDNAYLPGHLGPLVTALDTDPELGFAYSSCQYAGMFIFRIAPPRGGLIDLGQPLFRRSMLLKVLGEGLPAWVNEYSWDWQLICGLLERGVRWQHVDQLSFIFRLLAYPQYVRMFS